MPDPAQTKHAEFIKFSRHLAEVTGKTPGQVREALRRTDGGTGKIRGRQSFDAPTPVSRNLPASPAAPDQKFEPRPFRGDVAKGVSGPSPTTAGSLPLVVVISGVAKRYAFPASYIEDV